MMRVMLTAIAYRRGQAWVVAVLSALVMALVAFAPLYVRAMQGAAVDVTLQHAPTLKRDVQLQQDPLPGQGGVPDPDRLAAALPEQGLFEHPVPGYLQQVKGRFSPKPATGALWWRAGQCRHVRILTGSCPSRPGEILVTRADMEDFGLRPGTQVSAASTAVTAPGRTGTLRVVGVYRPLHGPWWQALTLDGVSGIDDPEDGLLHDVWLTDAGTFIDTPLRPGTSGWLGARLRTSAVGPTELSRLGADIAQVRDDLLEARDGTTIITGLTDLADDVAAQSAQARVTVPLTLVQLGLLATTVLWLVVSAAVEQRRGEVAVVRLRGGGTRRARSILLGELLPPVLAGAVPGVALAVAGSALARRFVLPGRVPLELPPAFVPAVLGGLVLLAAIAYAAVLRVAREPLDGLLRGTPRQRAGWALGVGEAVVISAAAAGVVAFLTGGLRGAAQLVAPALLSVIAGLVLAHLATPVAAWAGRGLLARGRVRSGVGLLDSSRGPATRRTVALVTIAAALAVFSTYATTVGARNRAVAAEQQAGAPMVAEIGESGTLATVEDVVARTDPGGRRLTTVASVTPAAPGASTTVAVHPDAFRRFALLAAGDSSAQRWRRLTPPSSGDRIALSGARVRAQVTTDLTVSGQDPSVRLQLVVLHGTSAILADLGEVPSHGRRTLSADLLCDQPCTLAGIAVAQPPGQVVSGRLTLDRLTDATGPVRIGELSRWSPDPHERTLRPGVTPAGGLTLRLVDNSAADLRLATAYVPVRVPVLTTTAAPDAVAGLDGVDRRSVQVGRLRRVPGFGRRVAVADLGLLERGPDPTAADVEVWFAHDDPALMARLRTRLMAAGLTVARVRSVGGVRRDLDAAVATWSLQLGAVAGAAAVLIAVLAIVVLTVSGARRRSRDLASLWLAGVPRGLVRRLATAAQILPVLLGVLAGAGCGVLAAHLTMPEVPLFTTPPDVSTLELAVPWPVVAATTAGCLVVLAATALLCARSTARAATLDRVREQV